MDCLYLNVGNIDPPNAPQFVDVTYDRRNYAIFGTPPQSTGLINWDEYLPMFGFQGRSNGPDSYALPVGYPTWRFSATNAATFTDLNGDNWPDLIVSSKGHFRSPFRDVKDPLNATDQLLWLDQDMIYLNRGNDKDGKWLGFWNRSWDLLENSPDYSNSGAPMGIAVSDYDMDGDMDFFLTDFADPGNSTDIHMASMFFRNDTETILKASPAAVGMQDLAFISSGNQNVEPKYATAPGDLHGDLILPFWFGWGAVFRDFDLDGDMDAYLASKQGTLEVSNTFRLDALFSNFDQNGILGPVSAWDRVFESQRVQDPDVFDPASPGLDFAAQLLDYNPSENLLDEYDTSGNLTPNRPFHANPHLSTPRRFNSRNVIAGDYNRDGFADLVVLPGANPPEHNQTIQLLEGWDTSDPLGDRDSNWVVLELSQTDMSGEPVGNSFAIGTKVQLTAKLDGSNEETQLRELRIGESNGGTAHGLPLEFGLGQHPVTTPATKVKVSVTWPCGCQDEFEQDPPDKGVPSGHIIPLNHTIHFVSPVSWSLSAVSVTPPLNNKPWEKVKVAAVMTAIGNLDPELAGAELAVKRSNMIEPFVPYAMDHIPVVAPPSGTFEFDLSVLHLPMDTDLSGMPIPTPYDLQVRGRSRTIMAMERIDPSAMTIDLITETQTMNLNVSPGTFFDRAMWTPADSDVQYYYIVVDVTIDPLISGNRELTVTCPSDLPLPPGVTVKGFNSDSTLVFTVPTTPQPRWGDFTFRFQNTGSLGFKVDSIRRGRAPSQ